MIYLAILFTVVLTGCADVAQQLRPDLFYQRDVRMRVNGESFQGVGVPLPSSRYRIEVSGAGKIDLVTFTSCGREFKYEPKTSGWFSQGNTYTYDFTPLQSIEDRTTCALDVGIYEKVGGRHGWGLIEFETDETVPATVFCNGEVKVFGGVSVCQSREGLIQKIVFDRKVKHSPDEKRCDNFKTTDEITFENVLPKGECNYQFCDRDGNCHKHVSLGYESILIRGAE